MSGDVTSMADVVNVVMATHINYTVAVTTADMKRTSIKMAFEEIRYL